MRNANSIWIEKDRGYTPLDVAQIFNWTEAYLEDSPGFVPHVAFTIVRGRNAVPSPRNRRIGTEEWFLETFEPYDDGWNYMISMNNE